ncbi:hypothetical protein B0H14DRAFT_3436545 [Mycena olivaceomarginata]|nr:hypothetical protein B0H14DRAFT_3436545 [Mycena olivaceomarginata]
MLSPGPSPRPRPEALLKGLGLGLRNLKPEPAQAGPKPGAPGQAGPATSLIQGALPPSQGDERGRVLCGVRGACNIELLVDATVVAAVARRCLRGADAPHGLVDALDGPAVGDARDEAAVQDGECGP